MTFNEKLALAIRDTAEERSAQMININKKHRFSLSYRLWKHKVLKDLRKNRYDSSLTLHKTRRIVITALAVTIVLFATTACTVVGLTIGRYSFGYNHEYSKLFMTSLSSDKTRIEEYYGLPVEDGWEINYFYDGDFGTRIDYICGEKYLSFYQEVIRENMGNLFTKDAVVEPMSLYEENDGFFISLRGGFECVLYWAYDGYLLSLSGNFNKEELTNLAYSTKIIEI